MHPGAGPSYGSMHHQGHAGYYAPQAQQSSYAPQYYPVSHGGGNLGQHATYGIDTRRRGYETALNDFFGDVKQRQIDPTSYQQVGQRLMRLQGIPIHGASMSEYIPTGPAMVSVDGHGHGGGHHGHMLNQRYSLPSIPNLRTKDDLLSIDHFLEQMQSTTYESAGSAAAAGVQLPGAHYIHPGVNYNRQSHSPPQAQHQSLHLNAQNLNTHASQSGVPMMATHSSHSNASNGGTPALTPPSSSSVSYTSGHSPTSSHGMSPISRHASTSAASYPVSNIHPDPTTPPPKSPFHCFTPRETSKRALAQCSTLSICIF